VSTFEKSGGAGLPVWAPPADGDRSFIERFARWFARLASPPERWSATHRLFCCSALAAVAFVIGTHGWRAVGVGAAVRATKMGSGAELALLEQRIEDARAKLKRLPAMKEAALQSQKQRGLDGAAPVLSAGPWHAISSLAGRSGMTLRSLQPGARSGDGDEAARLVRIEARANFAAFFSFLQGLSTLPSLVIPLKMRVGRGNEWLVIDATLQVIDATLPVIDALPAAPEGAEVSSPAPDDSPGWFADSFAALSAAPSAGAGPLRLLGLMHEAARGLALIETAAGTAVYMPGQTVGAERIVSVDARGVTLARHAQKRVMRLADEPIP
jgi:hypothetical protein